LLIGGAVGTGAVVASGIAVERDLLPGRVWAHEHLGLNGPDGRVPDVEPGRTRSGTLRSPAVPGREVGWSVVLPPDATGPLPVVVALHPLGGDHTWAIDLGIDRFLAAAVADGVPPFSVVTVDGGTGYWHPHDGEDAGAMVVDDLLPAVAPAADLDLDRLALLGWSMGGYGALRLAPLFGSGRVRAVAAASPAIWREADEASPDGFDDEAEYEEYSAFGHQEDLEAIDVRIDCGDGDPFRYDVEDYVEGSDGAIDAFFEAGGHDRGYWRRVLPDQLRFLGDGLG
jgi:enterochelin esterase-like enzyme